MNLVRELCSLPRALALDSLDMSALGIQVEPSPGVTGDGRCAESPGRCCSSLLALSLLPGAVFAQSSLTGVVKDTSGAVLPGVTMEASSPVFIEKVRSAVTDADGQYRLIDLRGGVYTVTITFGGFATVKREAYD